MKHASRRVLGAAALSGVLAAAAAADLGWALRSVMRELPAVEATLACSGRP